MSTYSIVEVNYNNGNNLNWKANNGTARYEGGKLSWCSPDNELCIISVDHITSIVIDDIKVL